MFINKQPFHQLWLRAITVSVMFAILLTACNSTPPATPTPAPTDTPVPAKEPVIISWWSVASEDYSDETQQALVKEFEAKHPNIKVDLSILSEDEFDKAMSTALEAGQGAPDVAFYWNSNWYPQALDLSELIRRDNFDITMYIPGFWQTRALWQDKIIGLPLGVGANFVMYNKSMFDKAGVLYPTESWTTEDWLKTVKQFHDPKRQQWGGDLPRGPYRAIWFNYGARSYSEDSKTVAGYLNGAESVAAYTWLWDLVETDSTPTLKEMADSGNMNTGPVGLFLQQKLAMATLNQSHMIAAMKAKIDFGIVPEPQVENNPRYVNAWSLTASIWGKTAHPDEAWTFLKWWAGPEGQLFLMEHGNFFPSIPRILSQYKDSDKEYAIAFSKILQLYQVAEWQNTHPCGSAVLREAKPLWDKILNRQIKREEIQGDLDAIVPSAQKVLDECRAKLGG